MRIYKHAERELNTTVHVQPGKEFPDISDWKDEQGIPLLIPVQFTNGVAEVPSNLGRYMLDKGLAFRNRIVIPEGATA